MKNIIVLQLILAICLYAPILYYWSLHDDVVEMCVVWTIVQYIVSEGLITSDSEILSQ